MLLFFFGAVVCGDWIPFGSIDMFRRKKNWTDEHFSGESMFLNGFFWFCVRLNKLVTVYTHEKKYVWKLMLVTATK